MPLWGHIYSGRPCCVKQNVANFSENGITPTREGQHDNTRQANCQREGGNQVQKTTHGHGPSQWRANYSHVKHELKLQYTHVQAIQTRGQISTDVAARALCLITGSTDGAAMALCLITGSLSQASFLHIVVLVRLLTTSLTALRMAVFVRAAPFVLLVFFLMTVANEVYGDQLHSHIRTYIYKPSL